MGTNVVATLIRDNQAEENKNDSEKTPPALVGKVSAINGNSITVVSNKNNNTQNTLTFTVDAANAKILRGETVIKVSDIFVGDNVIVQGTVNGTSITATFIRDGKVGKGNNQNDNNQALLQIQSNGQPVIGGKITAINGNTVTVASNSNVTYTVDATNAKIVQGKGIATLSVLKVGDLVIVQGTVNGTAVVASTIIDQVNQADQKAEKKVNKGFFSSIGQWFVRLFRF